MQVEFNDFGNQKSEKMLLDIIRDCLGMHQME